MTFWTLALLLVRVIAWTLRGISTIPFSSDKLKNCSEAWKNSEYVLTFMMMIGMNETNRKIECCTQQCSPSSDVSISVAYLAINITQWLSQEEVFRSKELKFSAKSHENTAIKLEPRKLSFYTFQLYFSMSFEVPAIRYFFLCKMEIILKVFCES